MTSSRTHARQPREAPTRVGRQKGCPPAPLGVPGAVGAGGGCAHGPGGRPAASEVAIVMIMIVIVEEGVVLSGQKKRIPAGRLNSVP